MHRRWFRIMVFLVLFFLLALLISKTTYIFYPLIQLIGAVAFPVIGAGLLFYLTKPIMEFFEKRKIPRLLSILLVFLVILLVLALFVLFIWPIAREQFTNLINNIPQMVQTAQDFIVYWQENFTALPDQIVTAIEDFTNNIPTMLENIAQNLFGFLGSIIGTVISLAASIILIPFFLFFMLKDGDKLIPFITQFFEKKKAENIRSLLLKIDHVLSAFIQGQLIVSFAVAVLLLIGYYIIGLDYALALALFGMVTNVIPFLGPYIAVIPALIVGTLQDPANLIWVSLIMVIAQQIEGNFISPNVMGQALHLHPLTIITVILAAGSIAGLVGIIIAVPFYAVVRTIIVHLYKTYVNSKKEKEDALL